MSRIATFATFATFAAFVTLVGFGGPVLAQKVPAEKTAPKKAATKKEPAKSPAPEKVSAETFGRVFTKMGIEHRVEKDDQGDPAVYYKNEGFNIGLFTYRTDDGVVNSIEFQAGFEVENPNLEKRLGDWNRKMRFARASLREDGTPEIRYDVDLVGCGVSEQVETAILRFQSLASDFIRHIQPE